MSQEIIQYSVNDIERIGAVMAKSKLFGANTPEQAIALCLIAQAEGRHPALAAKDYDIIQGKPAKKAEAMLRDFMAGGGKVEWHTLTDIKADATFSHPAGGTIRIEWDMERAKQAGLGGKEMWKKWPRQMLRSRVISEGVRTVCPAATSGFYETNEVKDFAPEPEMKNITPKPDIIKPEPVVVPCDPETGEITPHAIAVGEPEDWNQFAVKLAAAYKNAETLEELTAWQEHSKPALDRLKEASVKLYDRLMEKSKERAQALMSTTNGDPT
jgi:hypothetical protein